MARARVPRRRLHPGSVWVYSHLVDGNPWPGIIVGGFVGVFYLTEIVYPGVFEFAILYVAVTPLLALLAIVVLVSALRHKP